ncbi:MAG: hypothetical protein C5S49_05055 [Candidatus Methanogaster sp.]|nr:MAG: hypothetical protein C5S49_05055 [ANME-2 cluster archaeon]
MLVEPFSELFDTFGSGFLFKIGDIIIEPFIQCTSLLILILIPLHLPFPASEPLLEVKNLLLLSSYVFTNFCKIPGIGLFLNISFQFLHLSLQFLDLAPHRPDLGIEFLGGGEIFDVLLKVSLLLF